MADKVVGIYIWKRQSYLPVQGRFESGIWVDLEPVIITDVSLADLELAISRILDYGHPVLPEPTREEWQSRKDPVLAAAKARSWKEMARDGVAFNVGFTSEGIRIDRSRLDKRGRWEFPKENSLLLPPDTSIRKIAEIILENSGATQSEDM